MIKTEAWMVVKGRTPYARERNADKNKGSLPNYLTGNKNWNNISTLRGYRNLYQSTYEEYSAVTGFTAQAVTTGIGIACGLWKPCAAAKYSIPLALGTFAEGYSLSELKDSTGEAVRAIDARIDQLEAGC